MKFRRFSAFFLALLAVLCVLPAGAVAEGCTQETNVTTILFTHDLHSHFLPQPTAEGGESGGYARLKTAIDRERAMNPAALLVDGGDFSIGSLIQTLYTTQAAELRTMGAMGYDAVTIGNHEFDHKGLGFGAMLNSAKTAPQAAVELLLVDAQPLETPDAYQMQYGPITAALPALLEANYAPAEDNPDRDFIQSAMDDYGVTDCMTLERGGVTYGLFGLMGVDSDECAPTSGFARTDAAKAAKRCVETLKGEGAEIIVCLSHSGTGDSLASSEDEELAKAVDGIDVIISGHTHTTLAEPLVVNGTYIVSCGPYCQNLGSLTFTWDGSGKKQLTDYRLIPIDETVPEDPEIAAMVDRWKAMVGETYLRRYDLTYDQVLTHTGYDLETPVSGVQENNALGNLVSAAFLWADSTTVRRRPARAASAKRIRPLNRHSATAVSFPRLAMEEAGTPATIMVTAASSSRRNRPTRLARSAISQTIQAAAKQSSAPRPPVSSRLTALTPASRDAARHRRTKVEFCRRYSATNSARENSAAVTLASLYRPLTRAAALSCKALV